MLKITGTERTHARNQRKKTATRHLDLERNPTSLKGCTTTMYLVKDENYNVFITFLESAMQDYCHYTTMSSN